MSCTVEWVFEQDLEDLFELYDIIGVMWLGFELVVRVFDVVHDLFAHELCFFGRSVEKLFWRRETAAEQDTNVCLPDRERLFAHHTTDCCTVLESLL